MKNFKTFITESIEPFHSVKEVPAKQSLLDLHMNNIDRGAGNLYGKSKLGTYIPDRDLKHLEVRSGKHKSIGYGESFNNLEESGLPKASIAAHHRAIEEVNTEAKSKNLEPFKINAVHIQYVPHRTTIQMSNGSHNTAMTYREGASQGSGLREWVHDTGDKVGFTQARSSKNFILNATGKDY